MKMIFFVKRSIVLLFSISSVEFCSGQKGPSIQSEQLNEISGLANSGISDDLLYVVNDSGDSSRFFAINTAGMLLATYHYKGVNKNIPHQVVDCEEMASGPGKKRGRNYLYIGDIGDNNGKRPFISIYGFEEPALADTLKDLDRFVLHLKYPDHPRDAEAFVIDPILRTICVISKREDTVGIYEASLDHGDGDTLTLEKKGWLSFPKKGLGYAWSPVSANISRDGKKFLLKTYGSVYYWERKDAEPIAEMIMRSPKSLPYIRETQGETIAFNRAGSGYYCISEGLHPVIYRYWLDTH